MTVQAPQPPSPQPSLVPHSPKVFLRYDRRVVSGRALASSTLAPGIVQCNRTDILTWLNKEAKPRQQASGTSASPKCSKQIYQKSRWKEDDDHKDHEFMMILSLRFLRRRVASVEMATKSTYISEMTFLNLDNGSTGPQGEIIPRTEEQK